MAEPSERDREPTDEQCLMMAQMLDGIFNEGQRRIEIARKLKLIATAARDEGRREERWTCFHCGAVFTDRACALRHFGPSEISIAACQIDIAEYRKMEEFTARCRSEDSDTDRAMYRMQAEHDVALRREEAAGYAKGLADGRRGTLTELLADPGTMLIRRSAHDKLIDLAIEKGRREERERQQDEPGRRVCAITNMLCNRGCRYGSPCDREVVRNA